MRHRRSLPGLLTLLAWAACPAASGPQVSTDPAPPSSRPAPLSAAELERRAITTVAARREVPSEPYSMVQRPGVPRDRQLVVRGYLWQRPVNCPPCPEGANCGACPPAFFRFGSRPCAEVSQHVPARSPPPEATAGEPEQPLLVWSFLPEKLLDEQHLYFLRGRLVRHHQAGDEPVLEATWLYRDGKELWRMDLD